MRGGYAAVSLRPSGRIRSPLRTREPNQLGLHRVTVREISVTGLQIGPIEAIDGTPVVDIKAALGDEC